MTHTAGNSQKRTAPSVPYPNDNGTAGNAKSVVER